MTCRLLLIDRDGTLIERCLTSRYLYGLDPFRFLPGVESCLFQLQIRDVMVLVCTNQQGISMTAYPEMTNESVELFHNRINASLANRGIKPLRFFVCPHLENANCRCRKPAPGLLEDAISATGVDQTDTWFFGDQPSDMLAAKNAGVQPIMLIYDTNARLEDGVVGVGNWDAICRLHRSGFASVYQDSGRDEAFAAKNSWVETNRLAYDEIASTYAPKTNRFARIEQDFIAQLHRSHLVGTEDGLVVDIGCGPCRDAEFISALGFMYVGIDNSSRMLSMAATNLLSSNKDFDWALINADFTRASLPEARVSLMICNSSIQHIRQDEIGDWFQRIISSIQNEGLLYLHFRVGENEKEEYSFEYNSTGIRRFNTYYQPHTLCSILCDLGMEVVHAEEYVTDYEKDDIGKKKQVPTMARIVAKRKL